jgi:medium-chain acyl-[acyl-carrier-protein] hydrolase
MRTPPTAWIRVFNPSPRRRFRLFCFPYCGGGALFYKDWAGHVPADVEIGAIQLPGRESRFGEELITSMPGLVTPLRAALAALLDVPYAFFGHSMGSLIGFELARQLSASGAPLPERLFVSGRHGAHLPSPTPHKHTMSDTEMIGVLHRYNGTPAAIFDEPELLNHFLPVLRADFSILETSVGAHAAPLECPISAFGGLQDATATVSDLHSWQPLTRKDFRVRTFPGDHFYLKAHYPTVLKEIAVTLGW